MIVRPCQAAMLVELKDLAGFLVQTHQRVDVMHLLQGSRNRCLRRQVVGVQDLDRDRGAKGQARAAVQAQTFRRTGAGWA